jgi:ATP-binding cassette subfamily F protein uup
VRRHAGGYSDWLERHAALAIVDEPDRAKPAKNADDRVKAPARKLSYKLQRELDALPAEIDALELKISALQSAVNEPDFYRRDHAAVREHLDALAAAERQLDASLERWAELEQAAVAASAPPVD